MPHSWTRLSDTRFELLHFIKHQHGKGPRKHELGEQGARQVRLLCCSRNYVEVLLHSAEEFLKCDVVISVCFLTQSGKHHGGKISAASDGKEHIGKDHSNPVASVVGKLAEVGMGYPLKPASPLPLSWSLPAVLYWACSAAGSYKGWRKASRTPHRSS